MKNESNQEDGATEQRSRTTFALVYARGYEFIHDPEIFLASRSRAHAEAPAPGMFMVLVGITAALCVAGGAHRG